MERTKKYIEMPSLKDATHLEITVFYDKGGYSAFSGKFSQRGYYLSVTPVTKSDGMVSFTLFSGCKKLIMETKRFSQNQFNTAVEKSAALEAELIATIIEQNKVA